MSNEEERDERGGEKIKMCLNNDLGEEKGGWRWVWGGVGWGAYKKSLQGVLERETEMR
jgi:hypothetical protein